MSERIGEICYLPCPISVGDDSEYLFPELFPELFPVSMRMPIGRNKKYFKTTVDTR